VPVNTPTLVTLRLSLRPVALDDAGPVALMNSDVEVMRFVGGPLTSEASEATIIRSIDQWETFGYGRFAVLSRATGEFVGWVSLFHGHRLYPEDVEIGWRMRRSFWGQGLMSEAAARVLRFALDDVKAPRVVALADMENGPSVAVMRRIGMTHLADTPMDGRLITAFVAP
jgi:RimJ/RimL family protein N-acetyltransferase